MALSEHEVKTFPLSRCESTALLSCPACVRLQDPYCAWNVKTQACSVLRQSKQDTSELLQNIHSGRHPGCPAASLSDSGNCKEMFCRKTCPDIATMLSTNVYGTLLLVIKYKISFDHTDCCNAIIKMKIIFPTKRLRLVLRILILI